MWGVLGAVFVIGQFCVTLEHMSPIKILYMTWYRDEAEYLSFRDACADPENFEDGYVPWVARAQHAIDTFAKRGLRTVKVHPDLDKFLRWCEAHSLRPDGSARAKYAAILGPKQKGQK